MKRNDQNRRLLKRVLSVLLAGILVIGSVHTGVRAMAAAGEEATSGSADQIVSGGYVGNTAEYKTDVSDDGMVRVQKNVRATDTENEFEIYIAVDAAKKTVSTYETITKMLELNVDSLYVGGTANGFPKSNNDERTGNGTLNEKVQGSEKAITTDPDAPFFTLQIKYGDKLIAEPKLQLVVPNSVLYLKVGEQYIALENIQLNGKRVTVDGETPAVLSDGSYLIPVSLTEKAYNALFSEIVTENSTSETVSFINGTSKASIVDPMGDYITFEGGAAGVNGYTENGTTITWDPTVKSTYSMSAPVKTEETDTVTGADGGTHTTVVTTTTQWCLNVIEITYRISLDVDREGFVDNKIYLTNGKTVLNYDTDKSVQFSVPRVKGERSFGVTYTVTPDAVYGAPADSTAPTDDTKYAYNAAVTVKAALTTTQAYAPVNGVNVPGTWTFSGWDHANFNITENTEITGSWSFAPTTYAVAYVVEGDKTYGTPDDSAAPTDNTKYAYQANVNVADDLTTTQSYAVVDGVNVPGTWTFSGWDTKDFVITKDTEITGSWAFKADSYSVTYTVTGDATYGMPEDSTTPTDDTEYAYQDEVTVADALTTSQDYVTVGGEKVPGTWTFSGWDQKSFKITENTEIKGSWTFVPTTYSVTYVVNGDERYGTPDDSVAPVDSRKHSYKETVTVASGLATTQNTAVDSDGNTVNGSWVFSGWDQENFDITEDTVITGSWTFLEKTELPSTGETDATETAPEETETITETETEPTETESEPTEEETEPTESVTETEPTETETEPTETEAVPTESASETEATKTERLPVTGSTATEKEKLPITGGSQVLGASYSGTLWAVTLAASLVVAVLFLSVLVVKRRKENE